VRSDGWVWNLLFNRNQEKTPSMLDRVKKHDVKNNVTKKKKKRKSG
jgi:hypothetical protein